MRAILAGLTLFLTAPIALPETPANAALLREAFQEFVVIGLVQAGSGAPATEVRRNADGTHPRNMILVYLDAAHASEDVKNSAFADEMEGRPFNAADIYLSANGNVIWRAKYQPGETSTQPQLYFIVNAAREPVTLAINGKTRIPMFAERALAESRRAAFEQTFAGRGEAVSLTLQSQPLETLIEWMMGGEDLGIYVYSSSTVVRWSEQWEGGARLIKNYRSPEADAFDSLVRGSGQ